MSDRLRERSLVWLAAGLGLAIGAVALVGWSLDIDAFKSVVPGAVQIKANTAVALCLSAVALGLLALESGRWPGRVAVVLGAAVGVIGVLTLIEYVTGIGLGIDELLFKDTDTAFNALPGRMSPYTAWALAWLGPGLVLLHTRPRQWTVALCAAQAGLIGAVSIVGYLWNASQLVTDTWLPPVALNTAIALAVLAAGMFGQYVRERARHPRKAPSAPQGRALTLAFWTLALLMLASTAYTYRTNTRFLMAERQVEAVLLAAAGELTPAEQAELAHRRLAQETERTKMLASLLLVLAVSVTVIGVLTRIMRAQLHRNLQSRDQLRVQRALLGAVVDSSSDPIVYRSPAGEYLGCNEAYARILGRRVDEIVGRKVHDFFPPEQAARIAAEDARAVAGAETHSEELIAQPGGPGVLLEVVRTPLRDNDGRVYGVLGVARDITLRKQQDEELRRARATAEEATRMKSAFLANMSHEIRTPLNAIIGLGHLALQTELTRQQRDYLARQQGAARHLLQVVDEVLDMSKIEAGKLTLEAAPFTLRTVLEDVGSVMSHRAREKGLDMSVAVADDVPPWLMGDALRLRQVLLNYLNNAIKFTDRGRVSVYVEPVERAGDEVVLRFSVRDTGIGLGEAERERLFRDFEQADSSTTRKHGGTGLGLSISRNLARLMGGDAGVESEPRVGSTFWFTARLGVLHQAPDTPPPTPAPAESALAGVHVLLVEDNEINQQVAREVLAAAGARVTIAGNGQEALDAVQSQAFDVALMDMHMPVMDGIEATVEMRRRGFAFPIVAMTASAMAADRERCLAAGMNAFATKPIDPPQLVRAVQQVLPAGGADAVVPTQPAALMGHAGLQHPVAGLDWDDGLSHIPGADVAFYVSLLRMFVANHEPTVDKLRAALARADLREVKVLAHGLCGTAGTLGARDVSRAASAVEQACDAGRPQAEVESLAGELASRLTDLRAGLASALPQP